MVDFFKVLKLCECLILTSNLLIGSCELIINANQAQCHQFVV